MIWLIDTELNIQIQLIDQLTYIILRSVVFLHVGPGSDLYQEFYDKGKPVDVQYLTDKV